METGKNPLKFSKIYRKCREIILKISPLLNLLKLLKKIFLLLFCVGERSHILSEEK